MAAAKERQKDTGGEFHKLTNDRMKLALFPNLPKNVQ
jgi:hypothetical protein